MPIVYLIIGIAIGIIIERNWAKGRKGADPMSAAHKKNAAEHEAVLARVLELAKAQSEVTNDDVQKLLGVSDASAERYLQELESRGKLVQVGREGKSVTYKLSNSSDSTI